MNLSYHWSTIVVTGSTGTTLGPGHTNTRAFRASVWNALHKHPTGRLSSTLARLLERLCLGREWAMMVAVNIGTLLEYYQKLYKIVND